MARRRRGRSGRSVDTPSTSRATAATGRRPAARAAAPLALAGVVVLLVGGWWFGLGGRLPFSVGATGSTTAEPRESSNQLTPMTIESIQGGPHLVFQNVIRSADYAEVSLVPLEAPAGARISTDLVCERVHFAAGRGLCLAGEHGETSEYSAILFDDSFSPGRRIALDGAPAFAQVARDGRFGAISIQTRPSTPEAPIAPLDALLVDMTSGQVVANLDTYRIVRDGKVETDPDMDVWGVTFRDDGSFLASIRTKGNVYLVEGELGSDQLTIKAPNVSAPSLSPDGTRVAYAKLVSSIGPTWRLHVMDLETLEETPLAETRSIDEQPEWLDDDTILYGLATDIWSARADGTGDPQPYLFSGLSPAVVSP